MATLASPPMGLPTEAGLSGCSWRRVEPYLLVVSSFTVGDVPLPANMLISLPNGGGVPPRSFTPGGRVPPRDCWCSFPAPELQQSSPKTSGSRSLWNGPRAPWAVPQRSLSTHRQCRNRRPLCQASCSCGHQASPLPPWERGRPPRVWCIPLATHPLRIIPEGSVASLAVPPLAVCWLKSYIS